MKGRDKKWQNRGKFSVRDFGAFMVIIMTSLGLGNIWRFPYLCAKYGGAAFVLIYMIAIIFVVNIGNQCEICMGKFSRRGVVGAFTSIGRRPAWRIAGFVVLGLNVVVLVYYNNVIAWVTRYFFTSFTGGVFNAASPEAYFKSFIDTPQVFMWALLVNFIAFAVCWFGLNNGVEKAALFMGPVLFVVMLVMVGRTLMLPGVGAGLEYYLAPDWSYFFKYDTWMQAIGQGLWSGCFGWGIILAMGSYMKKGDDVFSSITQTGLMDGGDLLAGRPGDHSGLCGLQCAPGLRQQPLLPGFAGDVQGNAIGLLVYDAVLWQLGHCRAGGDHRLSGGDHRSGLRRMEPETETGDSGDVCSMESGCSALLPEQELPGLAGFHSGVLRYPDRRPLCPDHGWLGLGGRPGCGSMF